MLAQSHHDPPFDSHIHTHTAGTQHATQHTGIEAIHPSAAGTPAWGAG